MPDGDGPNLDDIKDQLAGRIEELAEALLGPPNAETRRGRSWRWGSKGSVAVVVRGQKRGEFFSHESGIGGSPLDLIAHARSCNFASAVDFAKRWLGIAGTARPAAANDDAMLREQARKRAERDAEDAADEARRISVARRLWSASAPIGGTIAERYLVDTRKIPRPDAGWPDAVRFHPRSRALIVAATDGAGAVQAVQRVRLTAAARKAEGTPDEPTKQTNGVLLGGAVARLPAAADGPLLLAEGFETGISLWVATGHEMWVALGNISNFQPPAGRHVVLCRDDDRDWSPADRMLRERVTAWCASGVDLVVATPWSERRGDKTDFNDVMHVGGADAVRAQVEAALNPRTPAPPRLPAEEGRRVLGAAIGAFFTEAASWADRYAAVASQDEAPAASEGDYGADGAAPDAMPPAEAPPVHLVQVDTGAGKSEMARQGIAKMLAALRKRGDRGNVVMSVPTHALGTEQAARFESLPQALGLRARIWRGRRAIDPDAPTQQMCRRLDLVREVQALKLDVDKQACGICPHGPKQGADCAYLAQRKLRADLWFVAHNMLVEAMPKAFGTVIAVVVDENPLAVTIDGVERIPGRADKPPITLAFDVLDRLDRIEGNGGELATSRLRFLRSAALAAMVDATNGPLLREFFDGTDMTAAGAAEAVALEWRTLIEVELTPGMTAEARGVALAKAARNGDLGRRVMFWVAVRALLSDGGPTASGWSALWTDNDDAGRRPSRMLELKGRRAIGKKWQVPTLVLDATARPELLRYLWPQLKAAADVRLQAPHQHIRQTVDASFALSRLDVGGARDEAERNHRMRNLRDLHAIICREARRFAPGEVLVVAQERIKAALADLGNLPAGVVLAHHNSVRGIDRWGNARALIVIGRTLPPSTTIARMTEALTGCAAEALVYDKVQGAREMADGTMWPCEVLRYADPIGEALRWQACEAEVAQIIGRLRGLNRSEATLADVLVLCDLALPLPVNVALRVADLDPSPADLMLAAGGIVFENPTDAAAAYSALWSSRNAAKHAIDRARLGPNPYKEVLLYGNGPNLMGWRYQRAGAGQRPVSVSLDPALIPDPAAVIAAMLGPLAWCRPAGAPSATVVDHAAASIVPPAAVVEPAMPDLTFAAVLAMPDDEKLALRTRIQAPRLASGLKLQPENQAPEAVGGYGEGLEPAAVYVRGVIQAAPSDVLTVQTQGAPVLLIVLDQIPPHSPQPALSVLMRPPIALGTATAWGA